MIELLVYLVFCSVLFYFICHWTPADREILIMDISSVPAHQWPLGGADKSLF